MIVLHHTILSEDIADKAFVCDLEKCKGACCVEGDMGAPLLPSELDDMRKVVEVVLPYLPEAHQAVLLEDGPFIKDHEGEWSTTTVENRECAFSFYDEKGHLSCGIERAWKDGKTNFPKPISCHLYPIRVSQYGNTEALNYHRWSICSDACALGEKLKVPVYKFLKNALVRKYGEKWYNDLCALIENR